MRSVVHDFTENCRRHFDDLLQKDLRDEAAIYIPRTAEYFPEDVHRGKPAFDMEARQTREPFVFLAGPDDEATDPDQTLQPVAQAPFLTLLVGQYGTGKTEFCYRLCRRLARHDHPLPISLAFCRNALHSLNQPPDPEEFLSLILSGVGGVGGRRPADRELRGLIRDGEIFLVLDALDELVEESHQHRNFFYGLRGLLVDERTAPRFRVLVTMRREYLSSVDPRGSEMLNRFNRKKPYCPVHFLGLDHFTDREIQDYLMLRLPGQKRLFDCLKTQSPDKLLYALKRPLLVKIFADMAAEIVRERGRESFERLLQIEEATQLLEHYVAEALDSAKRRQASYDLSDYVWDNDLLADRCVDLYRRSEFAMTAEEVAGLRVAVVEHPNPGEPPLNSISKCPFILRGQGMARFAHRVFYEYFTAKGVLREAEEVFDESEAFNELVVNPDIRKFLKYMVNHSPRLRGKFPVDTWHELTKKSCALRDDDAEEWPIGAENFRDPKTRETLNLVQRKLLDGMTEPETEDEGVEKQLDWFLRHQDRQQGWDFHPKYLMYCYHAAATYIHARQWGGRRIEWRLTLGRVLEERMGQTLGRLATPSEAEGTRRRAYELLAERILDIGLWFRFTWVRRLYNSRRRWLGYWSDQDSRTRILKILENIKESVF